MDELDATGERKRETERRERWRYSRRSGDGSDKIVEEPGRMDER